MKRKIEDQIVRLSFGDLLPREAEQLRAEIRNDPEAQRLLSECEGLRHGLRSLKDIPPDQLSTERLRHAILNQGLKPKPAPAPGFGWLWAPVSVALLAFSIAIVRNKMTQPSLPNQSFAINERPHISVPSVVTTPDQPVTGSSDLTNVSDDSSVESTSAASPRTHVRRASQPVSAEPRSDKLSIAMERGIDDQRNEELAMTPSPTLVLIASDSDSDTGAKKATEVDSPTDVVISG